jgi:S1-C subfamily serine protease
MDNWSSKGGAFCRHCGQSIDLEDRFCPHCGEEQLPTHTDSGRETSESNAVAPDSENARHSKMRTVVLIGLVVIVLGAAAASAAIVLSNRSSNNRNAGSTDNARAPVASIRSYGSFEAEYAGLKNAVVKIETTGCDGNSYEGTGFVIGPHYIVTADHVVDGSTSMTVLLNGSSMPMEIIGLDSSGDVALLRSDSSLPGPFIPLASTSPAVGEHVAAIGFPLGGGLTMTQGSVSAVNQQISVNGNELSGLVQTDTPLNHGNSGGPLVTLDGHAGGIVDALNTEANGTGYAVGPQYAASEVSQWESSPEHHALPLCSGSNPLGSVSAAPPPTGSAPAPSGGPGNAIASIPLTSEGTTAMQIVQSLANALANHQWELARSIYPALPPDSQLAIGYGALSASTVVVTNESDAASNVNLTGAYVAWETVNGNQQTSIYCIDWAVDTNSQQVQNASSIDSNLVAYANGWVDPSTLVSVVQGQCTG